MHNHVRLGTTKALAAFVVILILTSTVLAQHRWNSSYEPIDYIDKKMAVLIEFRHLGMLTSVLHNFATHLSSDWNLLIIHGITIKFYLDTSPYVCYLRKVGRLQLKELPKEPSSKEEYSELLKGQELWESIHAEHILLFQTDAALCRYTDLSEWLHFDYIGAPWKDPWRPKCHGFGLIDIGNGGLSLRRRSAMLRMVKADRVPGMDTAAEDIFFGCMALHLQLKLPSIELAAEFAMEQIINYKAIGIHQIQETLGFKAVAAAKQANCSAYQSIFKNGNLPIGITHPFILRMHSLLHWFKGFFL